MKSLGAKLVWKGREKSWFLDTLTKKLKRKGAILRIRTTDETWLTYKESVSKKGFKVSKEYQVKGFSDPRELRKIFERLGFREWLSYIRNREYWHLGAAVITLDLFPFGKFVEIEDSEAKIRSLAKKLDLDFAKSTAKSYIQLLREHQNNFLR